MERLFAALGLLVCLGTLAGSRLLPKISYSAFQQIILLGVFLLGLV